MRNYYMVRAMESKEEDFSEFFENDVVAVGWSKVDLSHKLKSIGEKITQVDNEYYSGSSVAPQVRGKKLNEIRRFLNITNGDYIVIPYYNSIRIGISKGLFSYKNTIKVLELDLANQLSIDYLKDNKGEYRTILRNSLSEGLQRRLRVRGSTVTDLNEFQDEIKQVFESEIYSWTSTLEKKVLEKNKTTRINLLNRIQTGKTNLQTGGIGLENLVKELFTVEGYNAKVLSKKKFNNSGDADVEAIKSDRFQEIKILVQIKHHSGYSDDWGLKQLMEIRNEEGYEDHKFGFITTANVADDIKRIAQQEDIIVIDGEELIDWIFENINQLDEKILNIIGIHKLPIVID